MKKTFPIIIIVFIMFSCGKTYDDGPHFTFRSAFKRIVGTWKVDKFFIDGIDSTDEYLSKLGCEIEFTKRLYYNENNIFQVNLINCNNSNGSIHIGLWEFEDSNNGIRIRFEKDTTFTNGIGPIGADVDAHWTILRLTHNEFNLSTTFFDYYGGLGTRTFLLNLKKQ